MNQLKKIDLSSWRPTKIEFPSFSNLGFQTKVLVACLTPKFILRNSFFTRISMSLISLPSTFMKYLAYQTLQSNGTKGNTTTTNGSDKMLSTVTTVLSVAHVSQVEHVIMDNFQQYIGQCTHTETTLLLLYIPH